MKKFICEHPIITFLLADAVLCTIRSVSNDIAYRNNHSDIKKAINRYSN